MENNEISIKELITLIYGSEDDQLANKVVRIFLSQQKKNWEDKHLDTLSEKFSQQQRDLAEVSKS